MKTVLFMALKDLVLVTRDWLGLFFIIGFPILMGVFFGSMYGGSGDRGSAKLDVAIVDEDGCDYGGIARWYIGTGGVRLLKLKRADGKLTQLVEAGAVVVPDEDQIAGGGKRAAGVGIWHRLALLEFAGGRIDHRNAA